jgi:PhoD-like phosphatase
MIEVDLKFIDFMDDKPLPGADVSLVFEVVPFFKKFIHVPGPGGPLHPIPAVMPDFSRAERERFQRTTDATGKIPTTEFNATPVFALVRSRGSPVKVQCFLRITFTFLGFTYSRDRLLYILNDNEKFSPDPVHVDLAHLQIGYVTSTSARVWFALIQTPNVSGEYRAIVTSPTGIVTDEPLVFESEAFTATINVLGLQPDTPYTVEVRYLASGAPDAARVFALATGAFRTAPATADRLAFTFGSCHLPITEDLNDERGESESLERWNALAARDDYDLLLLIGDQIYEYDIEKKWPQASWFERYRRRYHQVWVYKPMRKVLRRTPTYMILDDHEVVDDYGVSVGDQDRIADALRAYRIFQHTKNPSGPLGPLDFTFRRGPVAFFVSDVRSKRKTDTNSPILGRDQIERLRAWAASPEVATADMIVFVTSVPMALLPTEVLRKIARELAGEAGGTVGGFVGFLAGVATSGLGWPAAVLGVIGHEYGEELAEEFVDDEILYGADLADRWDLAENQKDLSAVLDILFGLGNGANGGRKRLVVVIGGDIHAGSSHMIRSLRPAHAANPLILHLTSSPISRPPIAYELFYQAVKKASDDLDITIRDLDLSELFSDLLDENTDWTRVSTEIFDHDVFGDKPGVYTLDPDLHPDGKRFLAEVSEVLPERNFGRLEIQRVGPGRKFLINASIEGRRHAITHLFEVDLDREVVRFDSVIGRVLRASGRVALLRVHDVGTGYGPPADRIDGEIIVELDTHPDQAFGCTLREDEDEEAHRKMLATLRAALRRGDNVTLDYRRTGRRNGQLLRVILNP